MFPKPRQDLRPNTADFERLPFVKATGFREYDARWRYPEEINLLGLEAVGIALVDLMRARGVPTARMIPISRDFCTTLTISTLAIPSATVRVIKNRITFFELPWACSATKSCGLVWVQLSATKPVLAAILSNNPHPASANKIITPRSRRGFSARIPFSS